MKWTLLLKTVGMLAAGGAIAGAHQYYSSTGKLDPMELLHAAGLGAGVAVTGYLLPSPLKSS